MKKIKRALAMVLMLAMAVGGFTKLAVPVQATTIHVATYPFDKTIDNMTMKELADLIDQGKGTYNYTDDSGNPRTGKITSDMCYISGADVKYPLFKFWDSSAPPNMVWAASTLGIQTSASYGSLKVSDLAGVSLFSIVLDEGNYNLSIQVNENNSTATEIYPFTVSSVTGISWPSSLTTTSCFVGDKLDLSDNYVTLVHANKATSKVPVTADMLYMIAGFNGTSSTEGNMLGLNNNCYQLGSVFTTNTVGEFDLIVRYNHKYNSDVTTTPSGANRQYMDSSFKTGYYILDKTDAAKPLELGNVNNTGTQNSPTSLNGVKMYHITVSQSSQFTPKLRYRAHVQNIGWQGYFYSPEEAGTDHQSLRMEALRVDIVNFNAAMGNITYRSHVQNEDWMEWVTNDQMTGTEGRSLRMEAVQIKFTGKYADFFDVQYRAHVQGTGWTDWKQNGETAGTTGKGLRMEAIEIRVAMK